MQKYFITVITLVLLQINIQAQSQLPSAQIQTLSGSSFNTSNISNNGKPIIIVFWESFCKSSNSMLDAIAENYADWQDETGVKIIIVAIDDVKTQAKVDPLVNSKSWEYEVYLDVNRDFKRLMSVNSCPHTFLLDNNGNIVYQVTGYTSGQEDDLYQKVQKLSKGKTID